MFYRIFDQAPIWAPTFKFPICSRQNWYDWKSKECLIRFSIRAWFRHWKWKSDPAKEIKLIHVNIEITGLQVTDVDYFIRFWTRLSQTLNSKVHNWGGERLTWFHLEIQARYQNLSFLGSLISNNSSKFPCFHPTSLRFLSPNLVLQFKLSVWIWIGLEIWFEISATERSKWEFGCKLQ